MADDTRDIPPISDWERPDSSDAGRLWSAPATPGLWQSVQADDTAQEDWRKMRALPEELDEQPQDSGAWHLPSPADTTFSPEDEVEVGSSPGAPPEERVDIFVSADLEPPVAPEDLVLLTAPEDSPSGPAAAQPAAPEDELYQLIAAAADDSEPIVPQDEMKPEDLLALLDSVEEDSQPTATLRSELFELSTLGDEAGFGQQTELDALAQLVQQESAADRAAADAAAADAQAADPADPPSAPDTGDSQDYASQLLAQLDAEETGVPQPTDSLTAADPNDPQAYAASMLASLGESGAPAAPAMDPREEELARRFAHTEAEIRALRRQVEMGELDENTYVNTLLPEKMIQDDDQVWWVMGAFEDQWYKFDNGDWVPAEPPRLPSAMPFGTDQLLATGGAAAGTGFPGEDPAQIRLGEDNMPLPRTDIPATDPDPTLVGAGFLDQQRSYAAETVEGAAPGFPGFPDDAPYADPAAPAQAVEYGGQQFGGTLQYDGGAFQVPGADDAIASPVDVSAPPDVDSASATPIADRAYEERQRGLMRTVVLGLIVVAGILLLAGGGVFLLASSWYSGVVSQYEAQIAGLANYEPPFQTVRVLDFRGEQIATLARDGDERLTVPLAEISPLLIHAVISTQNPSFYDDPGWDTAASINGFFQSVSGGDIEREANPTITEQIVRRLVLPSDATNLEVAAVAGEITNRYSKNDLLALYLNETFFGNQSFGAETAAQFYFDVPAADLNLPQAALIAGLIDDPVGLDPVVKGNREAATFPRMEAVMQEMADVGCLDMQHGPGRFCVTQNQVEGTETILAITDIKLQQDTLFVARENQENYPHFINLVRSQLEFAIPDLYTSGLVVRTTLSPEVQERMEGILARYVTQYTDAGVTTGAIMILDPETGAVRAYVGSHDFNDEENGGSEDYIRQYRAPGAAIMPVVYAAALTGVDRNGNGGYEVGEYWTPASVTFDVPSQYPSPDNPSVNIGVPSTLDSGVYYGNAPVRQALASTYTVSAVQAYNFVGQDRFVEIANNMGGLYEDISPAFSWLTAIGETPVRMTDLMEAYATIANGGSHVPAYVIQGIEDRDGNPLDLPEVLRPPAEEALRPTVAYLLQNILSDDAARNDSLYPPNSALTLRSLNTQNTVGAVAGTSNSRSDLWTLGFTDNAVVGVWLGRPDGQPVQNLNGFTGAAPVWNEAMALMVETLVRDGNAPAAFVNPGGVANQTICPDTGARTDACGLPLRNEIFAQTRPAPDTNPFITTVSIYTWNRLVANEFCNNPADTVSETFVNISDPYTLDWMRSNGRAYAQRLGLDPNNLIAAPTAACDVNTPIPVVGISSPASNQQLIGNVAIQGQVNVPSDFARYQLEFAPSGQQNYLIIGGPQSVPQPNPGSTLGEWNTTTVPNGQYDLRLAVFAQNGGFLYRTVPVTINNPEPTPTPTPTPVPATPTSIVFPTVTPLPFDPIETATPNPF